MTTYKRFWGVRLRVSWWYVGFRASWGQILSKGVSLDLTLEMLVRHGLLIATSEPCCLPGGGVARLPAWGESPWGPRCQPYPAYS